MNMCNTNHPQKIFFYDIDSLMEQNRPLQKIVDEIIVLH